MEDRSKNEEQEQNNTYTVEERKVAKKAALLILVTCPMAVGFDVAISYVAYLEKPWIFVNHEVARGFVDFLLTGDFPETLFIANVLIIILIVFAFYGITKEKISYKPTGFILLLMGALFNVGHIYGGLSWLPIILGTF